MSEAFDPYYRWLGIPPKDQPPDHYRLLSVERFESHADVIAEAADRQMAHLRTRQSGQHADLAARLLNEIAAARVCLLSPAKKAAYDAKLARKLEQQPGSASSRHWPLVAAAVLFFLLAGWLLSTVWSSRDQSASSDKLTQRSHKSNSTENPSLEHPLASDDRGTDDASHSSVTPDNDNADYSSTSKAGSSERIAPGVWRPLESGQGRVKPVPANEPSPTKSRDSSNTSFTSTTQNPAQPEDPSTEPTKSEQAIKPDVAAESPAEDSPTSKAVASEIAPANAALPAMEEVARYSVGKYPLASFAVSADGQRIVVCNTENKLSVIDLLERKEIQTISGADLEIEHLAMVPDGRFFMGSGVTADEDLAQLRTYRVGDGMELTTLSSANGPVTSLAISANGLQFASGHRLGVASLNSTQAKVSPVVFFTKDRTAEITTLIFSNDNQQLVFGDRSGGVHVALISAKRPNVQQHIDAHNSSVQALSISSRGELLLSAAADGSVSLWQNWRGREDAKEKLKFSTSKIPAGGAALSPAGDLIATANEAGEITLWNATSGKPVATLAGHTGSIIGLSFLPEGQRLVSAGRDNTVRVWNCATK